MHIKKTHNKSFKNFTTRNPFYLYSIPRQNRTFIMFWSFLNKRMQLLHKASRFTNNTRDLKQIYMLQIRSKLDQSAVVWHSSLSQNNRNDLERVQKLALRCILGDNYKSYEDSLKNLGLVTLEEKREQMCIKFAKGCLKLENMKKLFP